MNKPHHNSNRPRKEQLTLTIKGEFAMDEYKNMVYDKVSRFNLEQKDPSHPAITGVMDHKTDRIIVITFEGLKEDIETVAVIAKRGPVFSRIDDVKEKWGQPSHKFTSFGRRLVGKAAKSTKALFFKRATKSKASSDDAASRSRRPRRRKRSRRPS